MKVITSVGLILLLQSVQIYAIKYINYTLYRTVPFENNHLQFLRSLPKKYKVNFWIEPGPKNMPVDFVISPENRGNFLKEADANKLIVSPMIEDVQEAFDKQAIKAYTRTKISTFDWEHYHKLKDIYNWMEDLGIKYPGIIKVYSIGISHKGRPILCAQIKHRPTTRSNIIIEGGIHAREWISPAVVTYLMYQILTAPSSTNEYLKSVAELYDWYFVPVLNPDGYEYTHTADRMWRKNRNSTGIDLNRNFGVGFSNANNDPSSEVFPGHEAFSETESQAMENLIRKHSENLEYYVSFHSYAQVILIPYGHTKEKLDNYDQMKVIAENAIKFITKKNGTRYSAGTYFEVSGDLAGGSSSSWVKKIHRVPYVMTIELRDRGVYGFTLPSDQILPTCLEILDGFIQITLPKSDHFLKLPVTAPLVRAGNSGNNISKFDAFVLIISLTINM